MNRSPNRGAADLQTARNFGIADSGPVELSHLIGLESGGDEPPQFFAVSPRRRAYLSVRFHILTQLRHASSG